MSTLKVNTLQALSGGVVGMGDDVLQRPALQDYAELIGTPSIASGVLTLDLQVGNVFDVSHNANITTLTISNPPVSGRLGSFTLFLTQDATGGRTITWPASVKWSGGTPPSLSTTANKLNKLVFDTRDGGANWLGGLVGKDY
jgi:hypothetical protein